jgi:hypothetical protein
VTLGPHVVLVVGRMAQAERYKGHDQLIEAWPAVVDVVPRVRGAVLCFLPGAPEIRRVMYADLPTRTLSMQGDTYIYKIQSDLFDTTPNEWVIRFFHSWDDVVGTSNAEYRIPTLASTIEVMYRVRKPDSTESKLYRLTCDRWNN